MSKAAEKALKEQIKKIKIAIKERSYGHGRSMYNLGKELYDTQIVINWKYTEYRSFAGFIRTEFPNMEVQRVYAKVYDISTLYKHGYTEEEILEAIDALAFRKVITICSVIKRKMPIARMIKKYHGVSNSKIVAEYATGTATTDEAFGFSLPEDHAQKFTGILINFGMTCPNGNNRAGVRHAMTAFLDSL